MKPKTIYLDRVRRRKTSTELFWIGVVDGDIIARDVELEDCKRDARDYVEHVLETTVNTIVRIA